MRRQNGGLDHFASTVTQYQFWLCTASDLSFLKIYNFRFKFNCIVRPAIAPNLFISTKRNVAYQVHTLKQKIDINFKILNSRDWKKIRYEIFYYT